MIEDKRPSPDASIPHAPTGLAGRLIVSVPQLNDGPFERSVVLIGRHDEDHAFGVIVNKPIAGLQVGKAVQEVRLSPALTSEDAPVYFGGPCEPQRGIVLHTDEYTSSETMRIGERLCLTATRDALERLNGDRLRPATSRLIAGHAGWSAGQLDDELRRNYWLDLAATPDFIFDTPPDSMWEAAFKEIGVSPSNLSAYGNLGGTDPAPIN